VPRNLPLLIQFTVGGNYKRQNRMNRLLFIALLFSTLVSCDSSNLFEKVDFNDGDKLVFKYMNEDFITPEEDHEFHKKNGHFYISDVNALNSLKGLLKEKTNRPSENSGFAYMITLVSEDKSLFLGMYDLQKEILFSSSYYKLRIEDIEKFSDKFIPIEKYNIQFQTIPSLKKGVELLKQNNFEVEHYQKIIESGLAEFNGMTTIKTTRLEFHNIENVNSVEKKIKEDLKSINFEYKLAGFSTDMDSVEIQIASNQDLANSLPSNYVIFKPYNETVELFPIEAYNIENVDLKNLFRNNNIKYKLVD